MFSTVLVTRHVYCKVEFPCLPFIVCPSLPPSLGGVFFYVNDRVSDSGSKCHLFLSLYLVGLQCITGVLNE